MNYLGICLTSVLITLSYQQSSRTTTGAQTSPSATPANTSMTGEHTNKTTIDTDGDIIMTSGPEKEDETNFTERTPSTTHVSSSTTLLSTTTSDVQPSSCSFDPCWNNGTCHEDPSNSAIFNCACQDGHVGIRCETTEFCVEGPNGDLCENGACVYSEDGASRFCKCFFGTFWDEKKKLCRGVDPPCFPNPCLNGGNCSLRDDEVVCACAKGFEGVTCEVQNECQNGNACKNGECVEVPGRKYCKCSEQYYWNDETKKCRAMKPPCEPNPCRNGGRCSVLGSGRYNCTCPGIFVGTRCEIENLCDSPTGDMCPHGSCVNATDSVVCVCDSGFYLHNRSHTCRKISRPCYPNPCKNDGVCYPTSSTSFNCSCAEGYMGPHCADRDYCVSEGGNSFCGFADCRSERHLGIFVCQCGKGEYFDYSSRTCKEVDFCPFVKCDFNEVCKDGGCACANNYRRDNDTGKCMQDFCSSHPCPSADMKCSEDSLQGFRCACKKGHSFNGTHCNEKAVCVFPNLNTCAQTCSVLKEGYACGCSSDEFYLNPDNRTCSYDGNTTCVNNTCDGGYCSVEDGVEICRCPPGFTAQEDKCVDLCASKNLPQGLCPQNKCESVKSGGFRCKCDGKYELCEDKTTCTVRRMCNEKEIGFRTCSHNNAICMEDWSLPSGFKCACPTGEVMNGNGKCIGVCTQEAEQRDCADRGAICRVSTSGRRVCRCPPFFHALGDGEQCTRSAENSYLLNLPLHTMSYRNEPSMRARIMDLGNEQPDINYAKVQMDIQLAMKSLFPEFLQANVLICRETRDYLDCKAEVQFYSLSERDLRRLMSPDLCQKMDGSTSTACLLPPALLLRSQFAQTTVTVARTDPCDDDLKVDLCGSETVCSSSTDHRSFNCSCAPGFSRRYKRFLFGTSSVESCKDIDECSLGNPCTDHMVCLNTLGSFTCSCAPGYRMKPSSGSRSEGCIELCNPSPCVHGACSKAGDHDFECTCDAGFNGALCNLSDDNFKRAWNNVIIVGAVLGGALLLTLILFIVCVSRLRKNKCADEPANMLYATELTERTTGVINNAYQKD